VAISSKKTFDQSATRIMKVFAASMPKFVSAALADERIMLVKFEELVGDTTSVLARIFDYCGLQSGEDLMGKIASSGRSELRYFDHVEPNRAFAHKSGDVPVCRCNLSTTFQELNRIPGPLYESEYSFDEAIVCPKDPTATAERVAQYRESYKTKFDIIKEANPKTIVEIGVRAGYSAWAFLSACPGAKYHGFDADNLTHGGQGGPWTWWAKEMLTERGYDFEIHAPFDTQKAEGLPVVGDFYHIDGDHTDEGVYHDLEICFRDAPLGATLLVDDYDYEQAAEVKQGVDRWIAEHGDSIEWKHVPSLRGEMVIRKTR